MARSPEQAEVVRKQQEAAKVAAEEAKKKANEIKIKTVPPHKMG